MNTIDNNSSQLSLQELQQRKHALETKRNKWIGILLAIIIVPIALEFILENFLAEDSVTRLVGITYMFLLLFMGYLVVKFTKLTWAINDVDREIKKVEKQQTEKPEKKEPAISPTAAHDPTWSEKVAKALGAIILFFAFSVLAINILSSFDLIHFDLPQLFNANYLLVVFGSLWIGQCLLRYRSDLNSVSRISLWSAVLLLLASLPLLYMEYKIGGWMMFLAFILSAINLFRFGKEVDSLKQDDMNC